MSAGPWRPCAEWIREGIRLPLYVLAGFPPPCVIWQCTFHAAGRQSGTSGMEVLSFWRQDVLGPPVPCTLSPARTRFDERTEGRPGRRTNVNGPVEATRGGTTDLDREVADRCPGR